MSCRKESAKQENKDACQHSGFTWSNVLVRVSSVTKRKTGSKITGIMKIHIWRHVGKAEAARPTILELVWLFSHNWIQDKVNECSIMWLRKAQRFCYGWNFSNLTNESRYWKWKRNYRQKNLTWGGQIARENSGHLSTLQKSQTWSKPEIALKGSTGFEATSGQQCSTSHTMNPCNERLHLPVTCCL